MRNRFVIPGMVLIVVLLSSSRAADVDLVSEIPDEPFDIRAERFEYTNNTFIASGGVTGRFEKVTIRADQLSGNPETGDLHMEGDIHFERENVLWQGSELDYNFVTQEGQFGPSSLYFDPILMSVDHVERVATNEYLLRGATFTTCSLDSPHTHATAKEARLIDEKYIIAKGVTFYAGKVPIFYVPYWRHTLKDRVFTFRFGSGSDWGAFLFTKATVPITENVDSITDLNLYSKRGAGVGQGFEWETPNVVGEFASFYLKDQDPYTRYDSLEARRAIDEERYRLKLEHLQYFTDTTYLNTKWNYLSDPAVLEEFFKREYRLNPQPENYGSLVYGNSYVGTEAFVSARLNDFYDNVDRVEYSADLYRSKLGDSPFYFQSENAIAHLNLVHGTNSLPDYNASRIDSDNTLSLPQRYGFLNLVPRASYRATYYSETDDRNNNDEEIRQIPGVGLQASFQTTKILSDRERWYGKGLRHKIEPYADYIYEDSSIETNRLYQFDEVDQLGDQNKVQLGIRNVLQTKRDGHLSRFIDLDIYTYYLVEQNGADNDFDSLFIDARMPLTKNTMVDMEGVYDWYAGKIRYFDTRVSYDRGDVIFSMEHLFEESNRSLWTPRVDLYPEEKVSFEAYARYDDNSNDIQEVAFVGYINRCCMRYGLGYHAYESDDITVMLSVGLSAFPEARIASGL